MAIPTAVNDQITDAVTQANVKVLAESRPWPWARSTKPWPTDRHSVRERRFGPATTKNTLTQASTNQGVMQIYSMGTMADAAATEKSGPGWHRRQPDQHADRAAIVQGCRRLSGLLE